MANDNKNAKTAPPLCVDLDGTLINSDTFYESLFALIKQNPLMIFMAPLWLFQGKARLKAEVASRVDLDYSTLPYNTELLAQLESERKAGRKLVLVTAANQKIADGVAGHLGLFDTVYASSDRHNLRASAKADKLVGLYGTGGFDYAGNDASDVAVWQVSNGAIVVNPDASARIWHRSAPAGTRLIETQKATLKTWLKAIRIHQWLKNALLFVPLVLDHRLFELSSLAQAVVGFIAFGLCASSVYLLNDLTDLPVDRRHESKKNRPLAAGRIPVQHAVLATVGLLFIAFGLSLLLPIWFTATLALYYVVTLAYSLFLKRMLLIDIFTLAGLFTIRIIAGGTATETSISSWLLAFSVFFFLSLALVKRFVELKDQDENADRSTTGRGYRSIDLETLAQSGVASAFASVLVLALYIDSAEVRALYAQPRMIWLLCPLVLYIITRIWILARRGEMHDDPVVFIMSDWRSQIMVGAGALLMIIAAAI